VKFTASISPELLDFLQGFLMQERINRFEEILAQRTRHLCVVLENTIDSQNINAVMRSAECFGIQDVHIINKGIKYKPAKKVLQGSDRWLTVNSYKDEENSTLNCIQNLKSKGYKIIATTPHINDKSVSELDISGPIAVFFGQEREGISSVVQENADEFVIIPMQGFTESFNISAAAAIMLYELSKNIRSNDSIKWQLSEEEKFDLRAKWTLQSIYKPELIIQRFLSEQKQIS
jgi:tRNA (guanosine-2'-O-)-methyltransferase